MTADPLIFQPEDDCFHQLSDDPYETESNWWSWNVPERPLGGWIHALYHPNRDSVTWRVFVWEPGAYDPARMAYYRKVEDAAMPGGADLRDIAFPAGGHSLKMIEPGLKYHVSYAEKERQFALDFLFEGEHPPRRFRSRGAAVPPYAALRSTWAY